jgi:hypothetical protein
MARCIYRMQKWGGVVSDLTSDVPLVPEEVYPCLNPIVFESDRSSTC